ncbi:hypothetical protein Y032_0143g2409 [Ancylostoma ceylanicum]|uniref:Uncharacterized protein n=1 Tax=Ancylostoma ceylanicum TaxID=53326 RepID=A0A016T3I1_9BILA|nr:hypothetical protein Y032_0143g2409 [Ancylostoma ceylanicum]
MLPRKNLFHVGPSAQAVEHGSSLCKSACVPRDTSCKKRKVTNVLTFIRFTVRFHLLIVCTALMTLCCERFRRHQDWC